MPTCGEGVRGKKHFWVNAHKTKALAVKMRKTRNGKAWQE